MAFDLPRNVITPVDRVEVRLDAAPHPFELENVKAIDENWRREIAAKPALFDGEVALLSSLVYGGRRLTGRCHKVRYATFLEWRRRRDATSAEHAFAHAMLVGRDNALIAARMGSHTVNAGKVYFAAGSFEPVDFPDGVVDLHGNMAREVAEETGLDLDDADREDGCHFISTDGGTVLFRRYFLAENSGAAASRIQRFVDREDDPEIDGPVVIANAADLPEGLSPYMAPLIDWHFANSPERFRRRISN